jgi:hypothetical protein
MTLPQNLNPNADTARSVNSVYPLAEANDGRRIRSPLRA